MAVNSQEISSEERGRQALNFIESTANGLNATPDYVAKVLSGVWDRRTQLTPRHYGITFQRGLYVYYINPFVTHVMPSPGEGVAKLEVRKYHADSYQDQEPIGSIWVSSAWRVAEGEEKIFQNGHADYSGHDLPRGTKNFSLALQKGKELIADMTTPIRF